MQSRFCKFRGDDEESCQHDETPAILIRRARMQLQDIMDERFDRKTQERNQLQAYPLLDLQGLSYNFDFNQGGTLGEIRQFQSKYEWMMHSDPFVSPKSNLLDTRSHKIMDKPLPSCKADIRFQPASSSSGPKGIRQKRIQTNRLLSPPPSPTRFFAPRSSDVQDDRAEIREAFRAIRAQHRSIARSWRDERRAADKSTCGGGSLDSDGEHGVDGGCGGGGGRGAGGAGGEAGAGGGG